MGNLKELDEALKYARGVEGISFNHTGVEFDDDDRDALLTLAAEVERLRSDLALERRRLAAVELVAKGEEPGEDWQPGYKSDALKQVMALRAEVERVRAEIERLNKENDDWHEASKKLREEAQTKEREIERLCEAFGKAHGEAQTARLALDVADKEVAALRARVAELEAPDPRLGTLWQAIDDAMAAGEGPVRWSALERIESAAYVIRTE